MLIAQIRKEVLLLLRDPHGLAVLFLMPAVFILIMSLALRDALDPSGNVQLDYAWLDEDSSYFALSLADSLDQRDNWVRQTAKTGLTPAQALAQSDASYLLRIPAGFAERIAAAAEGGTQPLVELWMSPSAPPQTRMLFEGVVRAALAHVQAEYLLEDLMGVPHADAEKVRAQTDVTGIALAVHYLGADGQTMIAPNAVQQSVPAWLVFAMFFVVLPLATSVLAERSQGSLQRLRLLNVSRAQLLAGKVPAYYAVNMVQLLLMLAVGYYVVPLLGGGRLGLGESVAGLWLAASALSLAAIGFALLVSVLARTAVQATTLGGVANLILGAIGGVMVPKAVMPPVMQAASQFSPMSWGLEACWDILLRGGGVAEVLPEAAALAGFGLLCFGAAVIFFPDGKQ